MFMRLCWAVVNVHQLVKVNVHEFCWVVVNVREVVFTLIFLYQSVVDSLGTCFFFNLHFRH